MRIVGVLSQLQRPVVLTLIPVVVSLYALDILFSFPVDFFKVVTYSNICHLSLQKWRQPGRGWGKLPPLRKRKRRKLRNGSPRQLLRPSKRGQLRRRVMERTTVCPKRHLSPLERRFLRSRHLQSMGPARGWWWCLAPSLKILSIVSLPTRIMPSRCLSQLSKIKTRILVLARRQGSWEIQASLTSQVCFFHSFFYSFTFMLTSW